MPEAKLPKQGPLAHGALARPPGPSARVGTLLLMAVALGVASHLLPTRLFVAALAGVLGLIGVMRDYRLGLIGLTLMLPWMYSPHLPHGRSLSLVNLFTLATLASWAWARLSASDMVGGQAAGLTGSQSASMQAAFGPRPQHQPLPQRLSRVLWLGYLLPIAWAGLLTYPHLGDAAANFPAFADDFSALNFTIDRLLRPLVFPVYAFLLAQALRESLQPQRYLLALGLGAGLPALLAVRNVWLRGADVTARDSLMAGWGLHANEAGFMLAMAAAPLLAMALGRGQGWQRALAGLGCAVVSLGLLATGTRGAVLALGVAAAVLLLRRRQLSDVLWLLALGALLALMLPESLAERLMLGWSDWDATTATNRADPLTQGRLSGWALLAPEILSDPIHMLIGHGLNSTTWMPATSRGEFVYQHPHNLYLEILLDVGLLGFALLAWAFWQAQRALWQLSQGRGFGERPDLAPQPLLRDYLTGAHAALMGLLAMGFTNLHFLPCPEQSAVWFSMAWAWAFWRKAAP
jgi:O-antigen ligase